MIFHVWFSCKRRRWLLLGEIEEAVKKWLVNTAVEKGIELLACETVVDHVHMLLRLSSKEELPNAMRLLKGRASREVFQQFPELRLDAGTDSFWQRGYAFCEVEPGSLASRLEYVRSQKERMDGFADRRPLRGQVV
jgi:putative transposase